MGMTGITIREDRAEMVDFSDTYMTLGNGDAGARR